MKRFASPGRSMLVVMKAIPVNPSVTEQTLNSSYKRDKAIPLR